MGHTFLSPAEFIADLANPALSFLPNALMIAVLGAVICGVVGTHVTLRGMAFLGDAVAHAVFPGLAIAFALQVSVLLGGAVAGVMIALLIAVFSQRRRVKEDTVIGIFFAASFALGLVIIAQIEGYTASLTSFLFGSITGVARSDIYIVALGGAVIMAVLWLFHSRLVAVSLDRETARAMGLNVLALDMLLYVCVTMAVVMSVRTVGNILVLALLITPAATARLLTERVVTMMWVSALIGAVGAVLGVYISWAADVPTGATIVLVLTAMFIFSFLVSPRHGVFGRGRRGSVAQPRASAQSSTSEPSRTAGRRVVGAAASVIALFGAFVVIPASSGSLPTAAAQESGTTPEAEKPQDRPQHKPGDASNNPTVPKDTIDPRTGKTHVCAGKKLLYQAHVDALYGTYRDGKLAVMVVDGMAVANPEDVCIRLAPDADNEGKEVSRLVVPEGEQFSFLGKPGDILWHAPQQVDTWNGWRPVWAGAGAFDPHHEYEVPQNFVNDEVKFSLVGADKPGNMEMFFYSHGLNETENYISTKNGPTHFTYEVGAHGHFGWTFSKAGQYTFTWQASTETTDGKKLVSEPTPITWLVGSDTEVGLPEGTTKNLNPIKKSAEDQRDELFPDGAGGDGEDGTPGDSENPGGTNPGGTNPGADTPGDAGGDNGEQNPGESAPGNGGTVDPDHKPIPESSDRVNIGHGHMDLAFSHKPEAGDVQKSWDALLIDGQNPAKLVNRPSGTFEFVIDSDRAKISTPKVLRSALENGGKEYGDKLWQIPQTQQEAPDVPWLGFNTEGANYGKLSKDGVKVGLKEFDGPGRMVTARGGIGQFDVLLDSANLGKKITFRNPTHDHQAFMFSAPGRYRAVFEFQATTASGEKVSKELEAYFLVAPKEMSSGGNEGSPGDGPGAGSGDGNGAPGADAGDIGGGGTTGGDSGEGTGDSNNKLVGILNETTGIVDSLDTGVGYIGEILESVRGIFGASSTESSQPEAQPEITPGDAHVGGKEEAGAATGATSAGAAGATGGGPARTAGGAVTGGSSPSAGSHSSGASAGTSGGSGLSSSGAAPLALDAMDADGGDSVDEGAEEELDGAESEGATEDSEYAVNAREGSADRGADKDQNAEPESKAIQLANALGQGGWIGGLMFGMGGMALLGGAFFAFIAWRLMRSNAAMAANGSAAGEADAD